VLFTGAYEQAVEKLQGLSRRLAAST